MTYAFENLTVWQKSREFVKMVYLLTADYPKDERFGLISQLRRAAVSVSSNIAEGSCRWSKKEQARFYEMSYGSLIEILNQLILSVDLDFLSAPELAAIRPNIEELGRMINALQRAAKKSS